MGSSFDEEVLIKIIEHVPDIINDLVSKACVHSMGQVDLLSLMGCIYKLFFII